MADRVKGGDPKTDQEGTTQNSRAGNPKRKRPNCHTKEELSRNSVGGISAQEGRGNKDPSVRGEGTQEPWRRGATGCSRLLRDLLVRYWWTVACVGTFVSLLALLDKTVENMSTRSLQAQKVGQPHASEDEIVCRRSCRWQHGRVATSSLPQRVTTSDCNINALDHVKILKQSTLIGNTAHFDSETKLTCSES